MQLSRRFPAAVAALVLVVAGCGGDDTATTTTVAPTTTTTAETTTSSAATTTTGPVTMGVPTTIAPSEPPITPDPSWELFETRFKVYDIAPDDVLNVRTGPGVANPVITTLAPDARGIRRYAPTALVGTAVWTPIQVPGGAGWVNARYLRPEGAATVQVLGTPIPAVADAAARVVAALAADDYAALAALASPTRGVRFSAYAYVSDEDPLITAAQLAGAASDPTVILWGYTDGEGAPIRRTIAQRLDDIAGSTALTSTEIIGHDVRVKTGNSFDNIAEVFPGLPVVEYHFSGTCCLYGGMDWESVRLVFENAAGGPRLVAVVQDTWTM